MNWVTFLGTSFPFKLVFWLWVIHCILCAEWVETMAFGGLRYLQVLVSILESQYSSYLLSTTRTTQQEYWGSYQVVAGFSFKLNCNLNLTHLVRSFCINCLTPCVTKSEQPSNNMVYSEESEIPFCPWIHLQLNFARTNDLSCYLRCCACNSSTPTK